MSRISQAGTNLGEANRWKTICPQLGKHDHHTCFPLLLSVSTRVVVEIPETDTSWTDLT